MSKKPSKSKSKKSARTKKKKATRLAIFLPPLTIRGRKSMIKVKALTDDGETDTSRNDEIELSINKESFMKFSNLSKNLKLKLVKGEVQAEVQTEEVNEVVILKANWISGKSPLQSTVVTYIIGGLKH
ncbi:MAG: hypothetical protein NWF08_01525 [Candidatus Bathyarchaeota archaeon]|nr:hypothetical protein [Candidatus Bathyarchaeota archaeon]